VIPRPAGCQKILHVQAGGVAPRNFFRPFFHDELVALAFESLEPLIAHGCPTVGAIEEVADHDVERRALARSGGNGPVGRRRDCPGGGWPRPTLHWSALAPGEQAADFENNFAIAV